MQPGPACWGPLCGSHRTRYPQALSAAALEVKQQLVTRAQQMFVADIDEPMLLTSFLGTHVLVVKGDLIARPDQAGKPRAAELVLATFFGKLKARTLVWHRLSWPMRFFPAATPC